MARVTKLYLVAGVFLFIVGLLVSADVIDSKAYPALTVALPVGAISLGLFFICYIFEDETARFDEEQWARLNGGKPGQPAQTAPEGSGGGRHAGTKVEPSVS